MYNLMQGKGRITVGHTPIIVFQIPDIIGSPQKMQQSSNKIRITTMIMITMMAAGLRLPPDFCIDSL